MISRIGSGSTHHATGICNLLKHSTTETLFSRYSVKLYEKLQNDGHNIDFNKCGSLGLATTRDRWHTIKRTVSELKTSEIECQLLTAYESQEKFPNIKTSDVEGSVFVPGDSTVSPMILLQTFASEAKKHGIHIYEHTEVTKVLVKSTRAGYYNKVSGVVTNRGTIECDIFVNCAGIRAREVGELSVPKVKVPVHACEHYHCILNPFEINLNAPIVHDFDGSIFIRQYNNGGLIFGGFEKEAKPVFHTGTPKDFEEAEYPLDLDHFYPIIKQFLNRMPSAQEAEIEKIVNSPESFTPDTRMIMGESSEIDGYFVAAGTNADTSSLAGGIGKYTAELIAFGETDFQLWPIDVRRFVKLHNNRKFLRDRVKETVGKTYSLKYPTYGMSLYRTGRKLRTSPLYTRLLANGAVYGENLGYERPLWFDKSKVNSEFFLEDHGKGTFTKPSWFELVCDEYMSCRRGVAIMDMSSFTKFELKVSFLFNFRLLV
jgi:pyruvate dehydrogenase phosphatase regulatory subunit